MDRHSITQKIAAIELYHRRSMALRAVRSGDIHTALKLIRDAMKEAHYRAKYNCAPVGPEAHKGNFYRLRQLRHDLLHYERSRTS